MCPFDLVNKEKALHKKLLEFVKNRETETKDYQQTLSLYKKTKEEKENYQKIINEDMKLKEYIFEQLNPPVYPKHAKGKWRDIYTGMP